MSAIHAAIERRIYRVGKVLGRWSDWCERRAEWAAFNAKIMELGRDASFGARRRAIEAIQKEAHYHYGQRTDFYPACGEILESAIGGPRLTTDWDEVDCVLCLRAARRPAPDEGVATDA